ncbi:MAG: hypothetical protein R3301_10735, partial [Saprospiraceae bacterium]|nr:hypothetical protein [Saprospiraceae bacterium]
MKTIRILQTILSALVLSLCTTLDAQTKLLRFPDIHEKTVVFCYGGDLWKSTTDGGTAIRLTAHAGQELFPKFSPDGKWIAFTGQYDGDEQVYVMPAEGGVPRQLTYYPARGPLAPRWGYDHHVYGWTPDGQHVLFRSLRDANGGSTETALYTVSVEGGLPVKLPMPTSGAGDLSPDGKQIVYSPLFRDFRTWKRYAGGWAQDLYIFDLETYDVTPVSHTVRTERDPMWVGNDICFVSDRDGILNLYRYAVESGEVSQLTNSSTWDVRWASSDEQHQVIFELNGELEVYDLNTGAQRKISITVPNDGLAMRPSRYDASDNIEDFALSPKGERALFVARGDVFTAPVEKGVTRNLTNSSTAHDKHARWSPDGAKISYVSDASGEEQIYLVNQDGRGEPEMLTTTMTGMLYIPRWAPDSKHIAVGDKDGKLYVIDVATKEIQEIADDEFGLITDYIWSPDGAYLAFTLNNWNGYNSLYIWSASDASLHQVTDEMFNEFNPAWGPQGDYLFYMSDRSFAPMISSWEWNYAGDRETYIYGMALRKDVPNLFAPESDEVEIASSDDEAAKPQADQNEGAGGDDGM